MATRRNAVKERLDAQRARDPALAEVGRLDAEADAFACGLRQALRAARQRRGLTLTEMAARLHVTQPTVSAIERGEGDIGAKTLARYLAALGTDLTALLAEVDRALAAAPPRAHDKGRQG